LENSSWCVLVIDMASITLNSRYIFFCNCDCAVMLTE
jgi:hypothetical protein